jgi:hypothetical protein
VAVIFITQNAQAHHVEPSGWTERNRQDNETRQRARPTPRRLQARPQSRNGQSAADPLPVHPPQQMTHENRGKPPMSTARKRAPGSVPGIRSWGRRGAGHDLRQRVEVSDGDRTVATAEVTTSEGSGGTARVSLRAEPGHILPGRRACLVDAVLDLPEVQESARVEAAFQLGDGESLRRLQERCEDVSTRPAGWSALFDANLPSSHAGRPVPDSAGKQPQPGA